MPRRAGKAHIQKTVIQPQNSTVKGPVPDAADTADGLLDELRLLWTAATPGTISGDLARARRMVEEADPELREAAQEYIVALERLEHWLHDR